MNEHKKQKRLFGLYDIGTAMAINRLLKDRGILLRIKTRREDDQVEIVLEDVPDAIIAAGDDRR